MFTHTHKLAMTKWLIKKHYNWYGKCKEKQQIKCQQFERRERELIELNLLVIEKVIVNFVA